MADRLSSPESEKAMIGSVLLDPTVGAELVWLSHDAMCEAWSRTAWGCIRKRLKDQAPIDMVLVWEDCLAAMPDFPPELLADCEMAVVDTYAAPEYAKRVAAMHQARQARDAALKATNAIAQATVAEDALAAAQRAVRDLQAAMEGHGPDTISTARQVADAAVQSARAARQARLEKRPMGACFGIRTVDAITGPLAPGEVTILAARTSVGKTAFACYAMLASAYRGIPGLMFSVEMGIEQIGHRLACILSGVDGFRINTGQAHEDELAAYESAAETAASMAFHVDDSTRLTTDDIRARVAKLAARQQLGLVVVDYLTLIKPGVQGQRRVEEVGLLSRELLAVAKDFRVPVLCLAQLNRQAEDGEPQLHHLRESGDIEQDAAKVVMLAEDGDESAQLMERRQAMGDHDWDGIVVNAFVRKNRNGPKGQAPLVFRKSSGKLSPYSPDEHE